MTTPILTYKTTGAGVRVDLNQLIASRLLIQANSGGGKSRAVRQLLEETFGRVQHFVIDPEGEFATLRERFDYVLVAKHGGEALASPRTARLLCRRLVELGSSAVFDLYELEIHERREWVRIFLTELVNLPRNLWRPILVVIDEAHTFAPQAGESQALDAVISLCTLGRKRGFAAVLATQRISKLHKDAAAELNNKMIGRTGLDVDVKRAGDELGFDKEGRQALPHLAPGEFFVYGPAISPTVTRVKTGDVTTTHPEPGQVAAAPPPPSGKVKAMLAQLADLPKEAEEEARTIEDFKRQVVTLRTQLTKAQKSGTVVEKPVTVVDQRAIERAVATAVKPYGDRLTTIKRAVSKVVVAGRTFVDVLGSLESIDFDIAAANGNGNGNGHHVAATPVPKFGAVVERAAPPTRREPRSQLADDTLSKGQRKILNALAELEAIGVEQATRHQLGMVAGYNLTGGSGAQHIADLGALDLIELPDKGAVRLTDAGRMAADATDAPTTLDELHERVLRKLSSGQRRIAEHLISIYPDAISRADLGAAVGYNLTGGSGAQHVADLVTVGAAKIPGSGKVVASDLLFPEALR